VRLRGSAVVNGRVDFWTSDATEGSGIPFLSAIDNGMSLQGFSAASKFIVTAIVLLVAWRWQRVRIPVWAVFVFFAALWAFQLFKYSTGRPL